MNAKAQPAQGYSFGVIWSYGAEVKQAWYPSLNDATEHAKAIILSTTTASCMLVEHRGSVNRSANVVLVPA